MYVQLLAVFTSMLVVFLCESGIKQTSCSLKTLEIYSSEATMFGAWCRKREGESRKSHSSKQHKPEPFDQLETTKGSECTRESEERTWLCLQEESCLLMSLKSILSNLLSEGEK